MFIKKLQSSQNNPEKSYIEKKARHEPLKNVHLIKKKINLIVTKEKIVLKNYVKNQKKVERK